MSLMKKVVDRFKRPYEREGYEVMGQYGDPSEGDQKILEQLVESGADLAKARHVIHYLYFASKADAETAADELRRDIYTAKVGNSAAEANSEFPWVLIAERMGVVDEKTTDDERTLMTDIAERYSGDYDGWEASMY
jgi:regulator of RNase E activity RraB